MNPRLSNHSICGVHQHQIELTPPPPPPPHGKHNYTRVILLGSLSSFGVSSIGGFMYISSKPLNVYSQKFPHSGTPLLRHSGSTPSSVIHTHLNRIHFTPILISGTTINEPSLIQIPLVQDLTNLNPHINDIHGYFDVHLKETSRPSIQNVLFH